ncbi:MAG TPA: DUF2520 domain-containing protein [Pelobium sp.]|nr:DUF2520 domain-containing protein [Pelobium sp.]
MKVAMLGAGNVATHLSKALIRSGNPVVQVWSRSEENAVDLALKIGANSITDFATIADDVDLVIIAVSDDAIAPISSLIPQKNNRIIAHTSGSTDISVLSRHPKTAVLYPLQTFSKNVELDFKNVPLCIEGADVETENLILKLAEKLSNKVERVSSSDRMLLHISAVFACNFTNYFYTVSQELLEESSLSFDLIKPLIFETVNKIADNLPQDVQTGPAKRNDEQTLAKHLKILENKPALQELYRLISQNIVKKYVEAESSAK